MALPTSRPKAVVLLSGGLDSAVCLATAIRDGREAHALTLRYGQRHEVEIAAATRLAARFGAARHLVLDVDLRSLGGSSLLGEGEVPKERDLASRDVPSTYGPARNTIFLSLALAWAEAMGADEIWIGVNEIDASNYPDTRPGFIDAFQETARLGTARGIEGRPIRIRAPLLGMDKTAIVRRAVELGIDIAETWSCYSPKPGPVPCGACDACRIRAKAGG